MRPICASCRVEMSAEKNGVIVYQETSAGWINYMVNADLYKCRHCGIEIIKGFGREFPVYKYEQEDLKKLIASRQSYRLETL